MLDKSAVIDTAKRYAEAVKKELSPVAIILFGSYVTGTPHENSDIDIGVVFSDFSGDWRKVKSLLWNIAYNISWDIEPHLLDTTNDPSGFTKYVIASGQIIYHI
jgi:predicted nucleotidyltransferase